MIKQLLLSSVLPLALLLHLFACSDFVNNVDPPIDTVDGDLLTDESQIDFLIIGVQQRFATTYGRAAVLADALADVLIFDLNVSGATFPSFDEIDDGQIQLDNPSVEELFLQLGELRFLADDLVTRSRTIDFQDPQKERATLFAGYLYGGLARYFYATYFGLNENEGGGVIDGGPFVASAAMFEAAIEKLQQALVNADSDHTMRYLNSIIARCYLFAGDDQKALVAAKAGLLPGDAPFQARFSTASANFYWAEAGRGRNQFVLESRFQTYVADNPDEAARVLLERAPGRAGNEFWRQIRYPAIDSRIDFISWQENELIQAEIELRQGASGEALNRINAVRADFGIAALSTLDESTLAQEREKTLFVAGLRLADQRRFGTFHLAAGAWRYLPIPESERLNNPNFD